MSSEITIPPNSPEAERATLGAMLVERKACDRARLFLDRDDFYSNQNRQIYGAICKILKASDTNVIDPITVVEQLRTDDMLGEAGGITKLRELTDAVVSTDHVEHYSRIVKQTSLERQIMRQVIKIYKSQTVEEYQILGDLITASEGLGGGKIFDLREDLGDALDQILTKRELGVKMGFPGIDNALIGLERGDLMTVGAGTSQGKTAMMTRMAVNIADQFRKEDKGESVLYITTEMSRNSMVERILPMATNVPLWKFRKLMVQKQDHTTINDACSNYLSKLPLKIFAMERPSIGDIRSAVTRSGCRIVFVDHLQRCRYPKADNRTYEIQEFMVGLKGFSLSAGISTVLGCQLDRKRDKEKTPPVLSDLRDSGSIEMESVQVLLLWKSPEQNASNHGCVDIEWFLRKNRNGSSSDTGTVELNGELVKISEVGKGDEPVLTGQKRPAVKASRPMSDNWYDK